MSTTKLSEQIENTAIRAPVSEIAAYLQTHIGQRFTAYLSGLKDPKTVGQWAAGKTSPRDAAMLRLRHAYHALRLISEAYGDETAKAWLFGSNRALDDEAPAYLLRHGELPEGFTPVIRAAWGFVEEAWADIEARNAPVVAAARQSA